MEVACLTSANIMSALNADMLLNLGFVDVAQWELTEGHLAYHVNGERTSANELILDDPNVLYAFVRGSAVQYIGKTTRGIRKRFATYRRPGKLQRTNQRCNAKIKEALEEGAEIRVLVFTPIPHLRYLEFEINLAAALEDSVIKAFDPPWNGRERNMPISEETEREREEENTAARREELTETDQSHSSVTLQENPSGLYSFSIKLGGAYFNQGLINPGVGENQYLRSDGEHLQVLFDDGSEPILSRINRRANPSGGVRVVGQNRQIAEWFQQHFQIGDTVQAHVIDANRILLLAAKQ